MTVAAQDRPPPGRATATSPCPHPAGGPGANLAFRNVGISKEGRGNAVLSHPRCPGQQYAALMLTAGPMQGLLAGTLPVLAAVTTESLLLSRRLLLQLRALHTRSGLK